MSNQVVTESRPRPGPSPYWLGAGRRDPVGWIILRIGRALDDDWARVLSWGSRYQETPQAASTAHAHQAP
jgi:hypothetical protein